MHPLERWFGSSLGPLFRLCLVLTLGLMLVLARLDAALTTDAAPLGIISFELAGSDAARVLASFSEAARRDGLLIQGLDYLYLLLYSTTLASGALLAGRALGARRPAFSRFATPVAWLQTLAAACDAIENVPLILMLRSGLADSAGAEVARVTAIAKFAMVGAGLGYVLVGGVLVLAARRRASSS